MLQGIGGQNFGEFGKFPNSLKFCPAKFTSIQYLVGMRLLCRHNFGSKKNWGIFRNNRMISRNN